jgi:hypothetical protein
LNDDILTTGEMPRSCHPFAPVGGNLTGVAAFVPHHHAMMLCKEGKMSRDRIIFVALSGLALALAPIAGAVAQDGQQLAYAERMTDDNCGALGLGEMSMAYKQCIANEATTGKPGIRQLAGGQQVVVDAYGFQYGRDGALYDPKGRPIRFVPR